MLNVRVCPFVTDNGEVLVCDSVALTVGVPPNVYVPVAVPESTGADNVLLDNV